MTGLVLLAAVIGLLLFLDGRLGAELERRRRVQRRREIAQRTDEAVARVRARYDAAAAATLQRMVTPKSRLRDE